MLFYRNIKNIKNKKIKIIKNYKSLKMHSVNIILLHRFIS